MASCVIFDRLAMQTSEYRRFNVKPEVAGDDYAAMREALSRRVARIVAGEYPVPDLLVIDGGKGQVGIAFEVLAEQGSAQHQADRDRQGSRAQARPRGDRLSRSRGAAASAIRQSGPAPSAADPRRGTPLRHPGTSRAARARRAPRRRCRTSAASAPRGARRCSRTSADCAACRRRASTTWRAFRASAAHSPSASSRSCTKLQRGPSRSHCREDRGTRTSGRIAVEDRATPPAPSRHSRESGNPVSLILSGSI